VFPETFDQWGGYRLRKLVDPLAECGWKTIALGAPASSYGKVPHDVSSWTGVETHTAFDLNPYVLGSALKSRLRRRTGAADGAASAAGGAPPGAVRAATLEAIGRVWPDYYAGWVPFAVAKGLSLVRRERPTALLSSYPPGSAHAVALVLHRVTRLPWIADFRDPWAYASAFGYSSRHGRAARRLERAVCRGADVVTTVTPSLSADFAERYGREVVTLPQGFTPQPLPRPAETARPALTLVHAGTVSHWAADMRPLVRAALSLRDDGLVIRIVLVGVIYDWSNDLERAVQSGLLVVEPPMPRRDALERVAAADVALLVRSRPGRIWITTKLWDYLGAERPILGLLDPASDAARIIETTRAGIVVPYDREDAIRSALLELIERRSRDALHWEADTDELAQYRLDAIANRLAELLGRIAKDSAEGADNIGGS
jgi:glycosyltransferase involved in cell wall biosynthesis